MKPNKELLLKALDEFNRRLNETTKTRHRQVLSFYIDITNKLLSTI